MILLFNTVRLLSLTHWSRVVSDKRNATSNSLIGRRVVIRRLTSLCFRVSFSSLLLFNLPRILGVHSSSFAHSTQSYYLLNDFTMRLHSHYRNHFSGIYRRRLHRGGQRTCVNLVSRTFEFCISLNCTALCYVCANSCCKTAAQ